MTSAASNLSHLLTHRITVFVCIHEASDTNSDRVSKTTCDAFKYSQAHKNTSDIGEETIILQEKKSIFVLW